MPRTWRIFWLVVLGFHAVAASAWWWLMPWGFPIRHPRFWINEVVPLLVLALLVAAVLASQRGDFPWLRTALGAFAPAWLAAALAFRVVFPISFERLFLIPLLGSAILASASALTFRRMDLPRKRADWIVPALAAAIGVSLPIAERPDPKGARPIQSAFPARFDRKLPNIPNPDPHRVVRAGDGSLSVRAGDLTVVVLPLLRFLSRSPDGCWTILARPDLREGPDLRLISADRGENGLDLRYRADYDAALRVGPVEGPGPIEVEATARLSRPIWSHLNSFCDLEIFGHRRLFVAFSPCPEARIEVLPADYPAGRPIRLAYLDASGTFRVVEASSGEKGPFRTLASGRLADSGALGLTLFDDRTPMVRITYDDWPTQAGRALSPTAGWGLPVNAIEFRLEGDSPGSAAGIYLTLAGTSVGRGWDSVDHPEGTYRNRFRVEILRGGPVGP